MRKDNALQFNKEEFTHVQEQLNQLRKNKNAEKEKTVKELSDQTKHAISTCQQYINSASDGDEKSSEQSPWKQQLFAWQRLQQDLQSLQEMNEKEEAVKAQPETEADPLSSSKDEKHMNVPEAPTSPPASDFGNNDDEKIGAPETSISPTANPRNQEVQPALSAYLWKYTQKGVAGGALVGVLGGAIAGTLIGSAVGAALGLPTGPGALASGAFGATVLGLLSAGIGLVAGGLVGALLGVLAGFALYLKDKLIASCTSDSSSADDSRSDVSLTSV